MKKIIAIILITIKCMHLNAQYIQRSVIGSAGNVTTVGNIMLSSTVGEAITGALINGNLHIVQGFQQAKKRDSTILYLLVLLEGYYSGSSLMRPTLYNQGQSNDQNVTDTISVELRPVANPATVAAQTKAVLHKNSNVQCTMHVENGNYYIVVKHRNHIETWSANPVTFNGTFAYHDFTWSASQAYGSNLIEVEPGIFAFHAGDINHDENIDLLDVSVLENGISNFQFGYLSTDINGDANVDLLDAAIMEANVNNFIFAEHP